MLFLLKRRLMLFALAFGKKCHPGLRMYQFPFLKEKIAKFQKHSCEHLSPILDKKLVHVTPKTYEVESNKYYYCLMQSIKSESNKRMQCAPAAPDRRTAGR